MFRWNLKRHLFFSLIFGLNLPIHLCRITFAQKYILQFAGKKNVNIQLFTALSFLKENFWVFRNKWQAIQWSVSSALHSINWLNYFFYVCHSHLEHIMYSRFNHDNLLWNSRATVFDGLLRVCSSKNYNGVKLSVIQLVHSIGCHIQKGVLAFVHDVSDGRQSDNTWLASLTGRVQLCKMETVMASNRINNWPGLRIVTTTIKMVFIFSKC